MTEQAKHTAEILRKAATQVREGWCRGRFEDSDWDDAARVYRKSYCAAGAVTQVMGLMPYVLANLTFDPCPQLEPSRQVLMHLARTLDPKVRTWADASSTIVGWNDGFGQTAENVALGMEYAALLAEEGALNDEIDPPAYPHNAEIYHNIAMCLPPIWVSAVGSDSTPQATMNQLVQYLGKVKDTTNHGQ